MSVLFNSLWREDERKRRGGRSARKQQVEGKGTRSRYGRGLRVKSSRLPRIPVGPRTRVVIKSKYVRNNADAVRHISDHIEYIYCRDRGPLETERVFFDRERSDLSKSEVHDKMQRSKGSDMAMHKIIVSPSRNDVDLEKFAREWMEEFEKRLGYQLDWRGIIHENTGHHHIHFIVGGLIPQQIDNLFAQQLEGLDVKFTKEDLDLAREAANEIYYRERGLEREWELNKEVEREFGHLFEREPPPRDLLGRDMTDKDLKELGLGTREDDDKLAKDPDRQSYDISDITGTSKVIDPEVRELLRESERLPVLSADLKDNEGQQPDVGPDPFTSINPFERDELERTPELEREPADEERGRSRDDDRKPEGDDGERRGRRDDEERGAR